MAQYVHSVVLNKDYLELMHMWRNQIGGAYRIVGVKNNIHSLVSISMQMSENKEKSLACFKRFWETEDKYEDETGNYVLATSGFSNFVNKNELKIYFN